MKLLFIESYLLLLWMELVLALRDFQGLHGRLRKAKGGAPRQPVGISANAMCRAMDLSCMFYPKQVLCLQRSAATTILLRRHGVRAEMMIGVQTVPFRSHAWVEVDGAVVNDRPDVRDIYRVLERC